MHRPLPEGSVIKTCTISKKADGWYAALSLEVPATEKPVHKGEAVGVDVGLTSFVALSDGETTPAPKLLRKSEKRLKRSQRILSRRKKALTVVPNNASA